MPESQLVSTEHGLVPKGQGWFVLNARETQWWEREGRGAQAREDYPDRDDANWMKHTLVWIDENGKSRFDFRPVHMNPMTDEVKAVPPAKRVY